MALPSYRDFLERLRRDGVIRPADPRTLQAVEELLDAGLAHAPEELAAALASLLATTPEQWNQVQTRFRAFMGDPVAFLAGAMPTKELPPLPSTAIELRIEPEPGPTRRVLLRWLQWLATRRLRRAVGGALLVLLAAFVLGAVAGIILVARTVDVAFQTSIPGDQDNPGALTPLPQVSDSATDTDAFKAAPDATDGPLTPPDLPAAEQPLPPAEPPSSPLFILTLMLLATALIGVGVRWILAPGAQRRRAMELHDRDAVDAEGPRVLYSVPVYPPFPLAAMDAAATLLARLPTSGHGLELDVGATLHATVRAGGRTTPVLAPTRAPQELTILVDIERGDHPYLGGVESLLHRWSQGGLRFVRLSFEHHPTILRTYPDRRETNLDALGRRTEGSPLVLFARATQLREYEGGHGWLRQLGPWPVRAIVDLDPRNDDDPALLREERESRRALARSHVRRFPFTAAGLTAMAQYVGSRGLTQVPVPDERLRPTADIKDHLDRWASCLACVPDPSWAQLELFRREFFAFELPDPRYIQRLLDWVGRPLPGGIVPDDPITADGTRINLPRTKIHHHLARLAQADPLGRGRDLEVRARELIQQQLRGADPRAEGDRRLRDLKLAQHEAILQARDPRARGEATGLEVFIGSAMEEDLEQWIADQRARFDAANEPHPEWLRDLRRSLGHGDLQLAHLGQWLTARGLAEVTPFALLLGGVAWLAFGAGSPSLYSVAGGASAMTGATWSVARYLRRVTPLHPPLHPQPVWPPPYTPPPAPEKLGPITAPPTGRDLGVVETALSDLAPMRLIGLTGGEFTMGSPDAEPGRFDREGPQHRVHVSPFAIAEHPVTQRQWQALMGGNPSVPQFGLGDDLPVTNVSWFDALEFLNRLSERENLRPCYTRLGDEEWTWDRAADGYRLPTEAEWEYAARAGTTTAYSFGDDPTHLGKNAWYSKNAGGRLHPVGKLRPNAWRLFDMHGHVLEWTWNTFDTYVNQPTVDPPRSLQTGGVRVLRGGSFGGVPRDLRSARRGGDGPADRNRNIGFRCVRAARPQP